MKKFLMLLFGLVSYLIFFVTFLYSIGFVGNLIVPKSIDSGESGPSAILINIVLLSVFAIQHSVMARPVFKKWWTTIFSPVIERSIYVLLSSGALILLFWKWQPMTENVWNIEGAVYISIIQMIFWAGWAIVLISTFLISHFHLFGLLQVFENFKNQRLSSPKFKNNLFYKVVRHPIMLGFIIAFWATPVMTYGHFLFATVTTIYIFIAVKYLEERDLLKAHGEQYASYQKSTSMIIPLMKFKNKS
ncbi:MAG: methyltransferase [Lutibacter sp.]|nr:methyltransferase [Lutibacter sp.]MDP3945962.1 methyltransferase [Lutibacter sp.]